MSVRICCSVLLSLLVIGNGDGIDMPQKVLFPPERLNLKWTQGHRIGAGLQNMGNTCFLNSALQCLTYTPPFANYMLTREHSKICMSHDSENLRQIVFPLKTKKNSL